MNQRGILERIPRAGRHLFFRVVKAGVLRGALRRLAEGVDGRGVVVGIGRSIAGGLPGLDRFPAHARPRVPSTPFALWCWLRGDEPGDLVHRARELERCLRPALLPALVVDSFRYRGGRDLTGYEDGTENPKGAAAAKAALVAGRGAGMDGSSFVAVQQWRHDFAAFDAMRPVARDNAIGRRVRDNVELKGASRSAHVKRTAQEDFSPPAFMLRRSMPWADARGAGLMFVAFGSSTYAFDAQLRRMTGAEDGVRDALFRFTQPVTGSYFWCPPMRGGRLDLRVLGL